MSIVNGIGPFHVHPGHEFEGFRIEGGFVVARCACGEVLDLADAVFVSCPACGGDGTECSRCGATGRVVDHAALSWRLPEP